MRQRSLTIVVLVSALVSAVVTAVLTVGLDVPGRGSGPAPQARAAALIAISSSPVLEGQGASVLASVPELVNFQGVFTGGSGFPIADGPHNVTFRIYDSLTLGNLQWTETQSVTTEGGLFHVLLGSVTPLTATVFSGTPRYLEVQLATDPPLSPRQQFVSVPYAFHAESATASLGSSGDCQSFTASGTWTRPTGIDRVWARAWGGGGGGGEAQTGNAGSNGGDSSFGSNLTAGGGTGGSAGTTGGGAGGAGGTTSGVDVTISITGGSGSKGIDCGGGCGDPSDGFGGDGGDGALGGGGGAGGRESGPGQPAAGVGGAFPGGGGGAGGDNGGVDAGGGGGGGGAFAEGVVDVSGNVTVTVGSGGAGGTGGGGQDGGAGRDGLVVVCF